jgi:hypothetical protein|tara:strand:- start:1926 stop:2198 length:273 start_codon:yes stop_codon:yes gene_type:complete
MKRRTRSLLEELNDFAVTKKTENIVESRANHVIESAINIVEMIRTNFESDTAQDLEKRFYNSIKSGDPAKFMRGIKKIKANDKSELDDVN